MNLGEKLMSGWKTATAAEQILHFFDMLWVLLKVTCTCQDKI